MSNRVFVVTGRVIDRLSVAGAWFCAAVILAMSLIVFTEVVLRYGFNAPTIWSLEITEYMVVASGFMGVAYVLREHRHIVVDVVTDRLAGRARAALEIVTTLLALVYVGILVWYGQVTLATSLARHEVSYSLLRFPMWIPRLFIPVGASLLFLQGLKLLVEKIALFKRLKGAEPPSGSLIHKPAFVVLVYVVVLAAALLFLKVNTALGLMALVLVLLFGGVPVAFGLGLGGCAALFLLIGGEAALLNTVQTGFSALLSFVLAGIPMYILGSSVLGAGGIAKQLYDLGTKWLGHWPGGLAIATMVACGAFSAISGSTIATAAAIGIVALPELLSRGYDRRLAYGTVAAGGTLGTMIPPSLSFIVYGDITDTSVGKLFIAGIIPGAIMTISMSLCIYLLCVGGRRHKPIPPFPWKEKFRSLKGSIWGLLAPVIIIGGIYSGVFTPTEAAAAAVVYGLLVGIGINRTIKWRGLFTVLNEGSRTTSMLLFVIVGAMVLGKAVTLAQVPQALIGGIEAAQISPWMVMIWINIVLLILGFFLEAASMLLIMVPILFPVIMALGFDPVWFGVVFTLNMEIGMITPPVGMTMFTVKALVPEANMGDIIRGAFPFVFTLLLVLVLIMAVPELSTWLPSVMMGK